MRPRLQLLALVLALVAGSCATFPSYRYRPQLNAPEADMLAALTVAAGNEPVDGNTVDVLLNGDESFPAMLEAIRAAQSSIHFETYIFDDSQIGREFVEAFAERARAGVKVRLLLDAWGSLSFGVQNAEVLEAAGVRLVFFRPLRLSNLRKVHLRTHRKVLIVDGKVGFTGGICISDAWTGNATRPDHWRDTMARVRGPVVRQMQAAFSRAWLEATDEILTSAELYPAANRPGPYTCQLVDSSPGFHGNPARMTFLVAVDSAQESISITNAYFVPDHIAEKTLRAAAERKVRVRMLLPSRNTDATVVRYTSRSYYRKLLEAGVEIYEYLPARLHAKTMIVDGRWVSIGSSNLDRRSFAFNAESNLTVYNTGFASIMQDVFERDIAVSERITLEQWKKRPFRERFLERFYGLLRSQY